MTRVKPGHTFATVAINGQLVRITEGLPAVRGLVQTSAKRPRKRANPKKQVYWSYRPLDMWLELPRTRVLRAFRWFPNGATASEIFEALDLPTYDGGINRERINHQSALHRAVRDGELVVASPATKHWPAVYRTAPGFDIDDERPRPPRTVAYTTPLKETR